MLASVLRGIALLAVWGIGGLLSLGYFVVAFSSSSTAWWWWFVPIYGTFKIFQANTSLGAFQLATLPAFWILGWIMGRIDDDA
jgi:hypothetical protein